MAPSFGTVRLKKVWKALDDCLPGYSAKQTDHHWVVFPPGDGAPYRALPKGSHSGRANAEVQRGHVKRMAKQFGALDCFQRVIKGL